MTKNTIYLLFMGMLFTLLACEKEPELNAEAKILDFWVFFGENQYPGVISETEKTIEVSVPYGVDITQLTTEIAVSDNSSINHSNGANYDYTTPVEFTVTAEGGSSVVYTASVNTTGADYKHDFENLTLENSSAWFGPDKRVDAQQVELYGTICSVYYGSFEDGNASFENTYNETWMSWHGFAYSNQNDMTTSGYSNQGSVYATMTEEYGSNFALAYSAEPIVLTFSEPEIIRELSLANSAYAALSMKNGDDFSNPFSEGDYFKVVMKLIDIDNQVTEHIVELALFEGSMQLIQDEWHKVEFANNTKAIKSIEFSVDCSNPMTPTYFCIDNIIGISPN